MAVKKDKLGFVFMESQGKNGEAIVNRYVSFFQDFSKSEIKFLYKVDKFQSPRVYYVLYLCRCERFNLIKKGEEVPLYTLMFDMPLVSYKLAAPRISLYDCNSYLTKIKKVMYKNAQKFVVWSKKDKVIKTRIIRIRKKNSNAS